MASVTFPIGLGGDGSTVTDDSNATTGLGNGGHRARFVPALNQTVAMANTAVNSASTATTQAASATASASSASTSATNANNSFLSIDTKYLGEKTGDPTVDNQGGALATGAEYWNSSTSSMRVYNGTSWQNSSALTDFASNTFRVSDNTDSTKKVAFNTSGITTGTVRTLTIPNVNGTVITSGDTGTVTASLLANTAVTGGSYGSATQVPTYTVDAKGRLTAASNTSIQISESQVTNLTTDLAAKAPLASPTFTGTVTTPTVTTTGATGLSLTNGTSNLISFNTYGVAAPTFTTRSTGTKIVLYPLIASNFADFAFGIDVATLWSSVPTTSHLFKWYGGTTLAATLTGAGDFTAVGTVSGSSATGFRNKIINGDFQIWQAGTSFASGAAQYTADQWMFFRAGLVAGATASKQVVSGKNVLRVQRDSGNASTASLIVGTSFETIEVKRFAGKAVTLSFLIDVGANYSAGTNGVRYFLAYGTGTDGNISAALTGETGLTDTYNTPTTTLTQVTRTVTIPSNATQLIFLVQMFPIGTAGANDWFEITDVQLEEGSVATPFERRPYGLELSLCQRYYRLYNFDGTLFAIPSSSTACATHVTYPSMRVTPTNSFSGTLGANIPGLGNITFSSGSSNPGINSSCIFFTGGNSMTVGVNVVLNSGAIILSARL